VGFGADEPWRTGCKAGAVRVEIGVDFAECLATDTTLTLEATLGRWILCEIECEICRFFVTTEGALPKRFPDSDTTGRGLSDTEISRDCCTAIARVKMRAAAGAAVAGVAGRGEAFSTATTRAATESRMETRA
jgi:hypothetical protein